MSSPTGEAAEDFVQANLLCDDGGEFGMAEKWFWWMRLAVDISQKRATTYRGLITKR